MQIKIFIIGILIACSYLIGEYIHKAYTKRHKEVNDLIRILEIMRMDLSFGLYTLEEIFKRLGDKEEFCTSNFFKRLENELHNNTYKVLDDVLNDNKDSFFVVSMQTRRHKKHKNPHKKDTKARRPRGFTPPARAGRRMRSASCDKKAGRTPESCVPHRENPRPRYSALP